MRSAAAFCDAVATCPLQRHRLGGAVGVDVDIVRVEVVRINQRCLDLHGLGCGVERRSDRTSGVLRFLRDPIACAFGGVSGLSGFLFISHWPRGFLFHLRVGLARFLLRLGSVPLGILFDSPRSVLTSGKQRRRQQCRWQT